MKISEEIRVSDRFQLGSLRLKTSGTRGLSHGFMYRQSLASLEGLAFDVISAEEPSR